MVNKTQPTGADVAAFLNSVEPQRRRADGVRLNALFAEATGFEPAMWGPSIVGFGRYHYRTEAGREGDFMATGFSPRKAALSIYIMPGYGDYGALLARLGKHKIGKSCLYVNILANIDEAVLKELIQQGLSDLARTYEVFST